MPIAQGGVNGHVVQKLSDNGLLRWQVMQMKKKVNFYFALQSLDIKIIIANHTYNKRLIRIDHLKYLAQVYRGPKLNLFAIVITQSKDESSKWGSYPLKVPRFCSTNAFKIMFFFRLGSNIRMGIGDIPLRIDK